MFLNGRIREGWVVMKRAKKLFYGLSVTIFPVFVVGNNLYFFFHKSLFFYIIEQTFFAGFKKCQS